MAKFLDLTGLTQFKTKIQDWANGLFVPKTRTINGKALSSNITLSATDLSAIPTSQKGVANGVASLDGTGKVPSAQLPSYVDDVTEGYLSSGKFYKESTHTTAITGESGKIYVDLTTNKTYRWSGSAFVEISASLALGTTSSTAFRGDYGNTAYQHSLKTAGNPHNVTKSDVGLSNVTNVKQIAGLASGATNGHVVAFGADGYTVKDSGFTIAANVPSGAKFTDTTYSAFKGSTSSASGSAGLVPAPTTADTTKYLKADGTWATPTFTIPDEYITEEELTAKGYQTATQVSSAITSKGYQTASQVSSAISSATTDMATNAGVDTKLTSYAKKTEIPSVGSITEDEIDGLFA